MGGTPGISAGDADLVAFQGLAQGVDGFNECGFIQVFIDDHKFKMCIRDRYSTIAYSTIFSDI